MASSGGGAEMLDAPVRELEKLAVSYDEALKRVGLDGDARLKSGIDLGSKFSTINYGRVHPTMSLSECRVALTPVQDIDHSARIPTIATFIQKIPMTQRTNFASLFLAQRHRKTTHLATRSSRWLNTSSCHWCRRPLKCLKTTNYLRWS
jgi:hypothetical protein